MQRRVRDSVRKGGTPGVSSGGVRACDEFSLWKVFIVDVTACVDPFFTSSGASEVTSSTRTAMLAQPSTATQIAGADTPKFRV